MKTFKFEVTLSEEDVNGDEFYEECLEQPDGGLEMIRQSVEDALVFNNLIVESNPKKAVTIFKNKIAEIPDNLKEILLAAEQLAIASQKVIDSNAFDLSWNISEMNTKLDEYNKLIFEYES